MRVLAVLRKEWSEAVRNRMLLYTTVVPPMIFTVLPLLVLYQISRRPIQSSAEIGPYLRSLPMAATLPPTAALQVVAAAQFMLLFLVTPAIIPLAIAAYSVIGEKQSRSLEPLLATPIETWELLVGKIAAAILPGVVATWLSYCLYLVATTFIASWSVTLAVMGPTWLLAVFALAPLVGLATTSLAVIVSSRVNDARTAQQIGGLILVPIMGLIIAQINGKFLMDVRWALLLAAGLIALNVVLVYVATRLFQRESILSRWA